ncbi:hypothetical protein E1286_40685 [Nonomuraea terrae]|uniref:Uncharacterized protein n=1 Tax=Nonomuraea terrae TaxID=2530383 RepID=A0A4R4XTR7_9ACTN|nr:hypothetical protein [Nonomuraea terrae]TDD34620.1 hypothetical protein E1286_40685 [Nonomuraea terrae]
MSMMISPPTSPGARSMLFPVDDALLEEADPAQLAAQPRPVPLAYVGDQYDRDDAFDRYFAPAAARLRHRVAGKWHDTGRRPGVTFAGRVPFSAVSRIYAESVATVLLLPDRYAAAGRPLQGCKVFEAHNTPRAAWGGFGPCLTDAGDCSACPVLNRSRPRLHAFGDRVLVRELERVDGDGRVLRTEYHLMNRPEDGWASRSYAWTLADLALIDGWIYDRPHHDEHSAGFWLRRL